MKGRPTSTPSFSKIKLLCISVFLIHLLGSSTNARDFSDFGFDPAEFRWSYTFLMEVILSPITPEARKSLGGIHDLTKEDLTALTLTAEQSLNNGHLALLAHGILTEIHSLAGMDMHYYRKNRDLEFLWGLAAAELFEQSLAERDPLTKEQMQHLQTFWKIHNAFNSVDWTIGFYETTNIVFATDGHTQAQGTIMPKNRAFFMPTVNTNANMKASFAKHLFLEEFHGNCIITVNDTGLFDVSLRCDIYNAESFKVISGSSTNTIGPLLRGFITTTNITARINTSTSSRLLLSNPGNKMVISEVMVRPAKGDTK